MIDHSTVQVSQFRETIAGVEVVDAAFADKMLRGMVRVMNAHAEWRSALEAYKLDGCNANRNKSNQKRKAYRKARYCAWLIVNEATTGAT